ncbi:hypothetical protein NX059_005968 [Plenodomus lindquistii]|nr:hypothetical protein NX059_005968 [Plenodomus lindquistii]
MPSLKEHLPWISSPIIVNAPMAGFAGGKLAAAVTLAGGLGMIGSDNHIDPLRNELAIASSALPPSPSSSLLPIGIGILCFLLDIPSILSIITDYKPTVIWLFAANNINDYAEWTTVLRSASPKTQNLDSNRQRDLSPVPRAQRLPLCTRPPRRRRRGPRLRKDCWDYLPAF